MPKTTNEVAKAVRKPIRLIPLDSKAEPGPSAAEDVVAGEADADAVVVDVVDLVVDLEMVVDTAVKTDDVIADDIEVELILCQIVGDDAVEIGWWMSLGLGVCTATPSVPYIANRRRGKLVPQMAKLVPVGRRSQSYPRTMSKESLTATPC